MDVRTPVVSRDDEGIGEGWQDRIECTSTLPFDDMTKA